MSGKMALASGVALMALGLILAMTVGEVLLSLLVWFCGFVMWWLGSQGERRS